MKKMVVAALKRSIKKWQKIVDGEGADEGPYNCALCQMFNDSEHMCRGCPVYGRTGETYCAETPYTKWIQFAEKKLGSPSGARLADFDDDDRSRAKKLAQAELKFLEKLLPKKEKRA